MITTAQLANELNTSQRNIQNRIMRLLASGAVKNIQRAGIAFILTEKQAQQVRDYATRKRSGGKTL